MDIAILGHGCKNCDALEQRTREALARLDREAVIDHVRDDATIAAYGVMRTPGLVVDGVVLTSGHVPTSTQIEELLATL